MSPAALAFVLATAVYSTNALFGMSVRVGWLDSSRFRWVHHGLYVVTFALTGAAISSLLWSDSSAGWYLLPAVVPLAALPYIGSARKHPGRHAAVALAPLPLYILSLTLVLT